MGSSLRASAKGLEIIDQLRKRRGWNRQADVWCQDAHTTRATLKRFWQREPVQQDTFIGICQAVGLERWQEIVDSTAMPWFAQPIKSWDGVPDASVFYGRTEELATLAQWIVGDSPLGDRLSAHCRLVALLGMGGIGKTALAAKLADQIQYQFEYMVWRSLLYAPPVEDFLAELIQFLSNQTKVTLPEPLDGKISCLIDHLNQHRVLLVFDNLETILSSGDFAGHYREGYKGYGELLKRVGQEPHQSCLLLTSREKTPEIALLEGGTLPVRSLCLNGLGEAAREILKAKDLSGEPKWGTLIQIYRGNPLVLKIVATSIKELFDGNVSEFLKQSLTLITGDLSRFIEQQFNRLSSLEKQITYQLAQTKEPVTLPMLQQTLHPVSPHDLFKALESLGRRSLLEKSTTGFTLQPAVVEYVTYRLGQSDGKQG
jgi:hypothetical protein